MPTTSVATLIDRAKATADMRDNFVTPTQWERWASQERLALDLFLARSGWTQTFSEFNITVTGTEAGVYSVNPSGGIMAIVCVYQYDSAGRIRMLEHQDAVTFLHRSPGYSGAPQSHARYFRVANAGDNLTLNFYPEPQAGETYKVLYIAHPPPLVVSTDSVFASAQFRGFEVLSRSPGAAGIGTVVNIMGVIPSIGTPHPLVGTARLIQDTQAAVTVTFDYSGDGMFIGEILDTPTTYNAVYAALNSSTVVQVGAETVPGETTFGLVQQETETTSLPTTPATSVSYPMGWEERIVLGMARRALMKEESDTKAVDTEIALWESRIEEACWNRVLTSSPQVRNIDYQHYAWTNRYLVPPFGFWVWI